ncbi:MAG: beta strand repeat-containing protein [Gemmataceae bacterium]
MAGANTITFDATIFATAKTITLTSGELVIADHVTVTGPAINVAISGNNASRVFNIPAATGATVSLSNLNIQNGKAPGNSDGGGIFSQDVSLTLTNCAVTSNTAKTDGGGIFIAGNGSALTLVQCSVANNSTLETFGDGGGVSALGAVTISIISSSLSGNSAGRYGGGISVSGNAMVTLTNSTISGNVAERGAGLGCQGNGATVVQNCTIANNTVTLKGGGIYLGGDSATIESTIVSGNSAPTGPELYNVGTINALSSLIGSKSGVTTFTGDAFTNAHIGVDPLLGPLQNNGGPTLTHLPASASPARGNGSNPAALSTDQRGFARVSGAAIDIGAAEIQEFVVTNTNDSGAGSLRQAVLNANAAAGTNLITFDPSVFTTNKTITLNAVRIDITDSVDLIGPTVGVTVSGNNNSAVFNASGAASVTLTISDMTLRSGKAASGPALALGVSGSATLTRCTFTGNQATSAGGGAISSAATNSKLTLIDCTLAGNTSTGDGGAIQFLNVGSFITIIGTTISGNSASGNGGAIFVDQTTVTIRNSTISGNTAGGAGGGGGVYVPNVGSLIVQNSTFTGNKATSSTGGGIRAVSASLFLDIDSSIISGNTGTPAQDISSSGTVNVNFSAVGSLTGFSLSGSSGNNLPFGTNLKLGALANNGGATLTHLPAVNSPVINAGSNPASLVRDQRGSGFLRNFGGGVDIGAVESRALIVTNTNDSGVGSLRTNLLDANFLAGPDTITFDPTVFATAKTITLTSGELAVTDDVTVTGPTIGVTVSGNNASRVFDIDGVSPLTANFSDVTLTLGKSSSLGGGLLMSDDSVTLTRCRVSNNTALTSGGGISTNPANATLTLVDCTVDGNSAGNSGGGIEIFSGSSTINVTGCTIAANSASLNGGGIRVADVATLTVRNSTISGNSAGKGGGLSLGTSAPATVQNSTITNNTATTGTGGGIDRESGGTTTIDSSIVSANSAVSGLDISSSGTTNVNFSAVGSAAGFTLTGSNNIPFGANLLLGPLQNNGGLTQTHLPANNSQAVNNGSNPAGLTTDQRGAGFSRAFNGAVDIGAVELRTFIVTNTNNSGAGSLRQAVLDANATAGVDAIAFDATVFATAKTITLTTGELAITESVNIVGPVVGVTVSGNNASRLFNLSSAGAQAVSFNDLTLTSGKPSSGNGGAIIADGDNLTLTHVVISGCQASNGGAISLTTGGSLTLENSTIKGNSATSSRGGGIDVSGAGAITIRNSTIAGNSAVTFGGGVSLNNFISLLIENCTFSGNTGTSGGLNLQAPLVGAPMVIRNSTFSGNTSTTNFGGAIGLVSMDEVLTIQNTTVFANVSASDAGGIAQQSGTGTIALESTVVAGNTGTSDMGSFSANKFTAKISAVGTPPTLLGGATFIDLGNNLPFGTNLKLSSLTNNGGPTQTHAILPGSPLIGKGSNPAVLTTDQRGTGFARVATGATDIGAYEANLPPEVYSVVFGDGTTQRSLVKQIVVNFTEPVNFMGGVAAAFTLHRSGTGGTIGNVTLTATPSNGPASSVTLTFSGPPTLVQFGSLVDGLYDLTIGAAQISGTLGALDGNTDGIAGGDYTVVGSTANQFFRYFGDQNGDAAVDQSDYLVFRNALSAGPSTVFDFNHDGDVDQNDYLRFRQNISGSP